MGRLMGRTALVTGAGTAEGGWGNGKACAAQLARDGANVVCMDLRADLAEEAADAIRAEGGTAIAAAGDVSRSADVKEAVEQAAKTFGGLDILVNNVGIVVPGGVVELTEEDWQRAFDVNLKGCFLTMKYAIPEMLKRGRGAIVNISSISSIWYLGKTYVSYYTSKAAMNHMTRVTAAEYARRQIRVNAVLPGLMDTPMARASAVRNHGARPEEMEDLWKKRAERIPMGWMGDAFDVARAVAFLASDDARFITGQALVVDGGMTLGQ